MRLTATDIYYLQERDGDSTTTDNPATPIAFVIDGDVVYAEAFSPPVAQSIFLANPTYSSATEEIDGQQVEVVTATVGETSTELIVSELFASVLLSNALVVLITRDKDLAVTAGWNHDSDGFYIMQRVAGVERRLNGMGDPVSE
jgi:hypothetical protein